MVNKNKSGNARIICLKVRMDFIAEYAIEFFPPYLKK